MRIMCREKTTNYLYKKEGDEMKLSDVKKPNIIYHVKVRAHTAPRRFGGLIEVSSGYCDLFFTHKKAYEAGSSFLQNRVRKLYEASAYCTGSEDDPSIEDFIKDGHIEYDFTIMEIDLEAAKTYDWKKRPHLGLGFCLSNRPPFLEYTYNLEGDMTGCNYVYCNDFSEAGNAFPVARVEYRPGDEAPEAGTKFRPGDLVRLDRPYFSEKCWRMFDTDTVFVIIDTPKRDNCGRLVENTYSVATASESREYPWGSDRFCDSFYIHETKLRSYEGELPAVNPLRLLQKWARGEIKLPDDGKTLTDKLESGEISLRSAVMWRDIPEIKAAMESGKEDEK